MYSFTTLGLRVNGNLKARKEVVIRCTKARFNGEEESLTG